MSEEYNPFDFIKSVSETKIDLIKTNEQPELIEKTYNPYTVNKGLSFYNDTILHANEMNRCNNLFKDAQYRYYLAILRSRKRYTKWIKPEKNEQLDMLQEYYQCNRTVAKSYLRILSDDDLKIININMNKGGLGSK